MRFKHVIEVGKARFKSDQIIKMPNELQVSLHKTIALGTHKVIDVIPGRTPLWVTPFSQKSPGESLDGRLFLVTHVHDFQSSSYDDSRHLYRADEVLPFNDQWHYPLLRRTIYSMEKFIRNAQVIGSIAPPLTAPAANGAASTRKQLPGPR